MKDREFRLRLELDDVQETCYVIIKITFPRLNSSYSTSFAKNFFLSNIERHHIIDNKDTSIHIALDITSR